MVQQTASSDPPKGRELPHAPAELTRGKLHRLGEGIGKVVYASEHWVVRRERSPSAIVALIVLWRIVKKLEGILPRGLATRILQGPSKQIRLLRVLIQFGMAIIPKGIWFTRHIRQVWIRYYRSSVRGERLAQEHLTGSSLIPETVCFPPTRVMIGGWPGWLVVSEATERVDATLFSRLTELADTGCFDELEGWLNRLLDARQSGWKRGLFSVDAHLKNFGVCGERIVLLDAGGLTNRWTEIENRLASEEAVPDPHVQLGLGPLLASRPDIAERFNARWKATVNLDVVSHHWPTETPS